MDFTRVVEKIPIFSDLSPYQVQQFLKGCKSRTCKAGQVLCKAGEPSNEMFILVTGALSVTAPDGVELTHIGPSGTVGEMGLVTNMPRCATITAVTPVNVLVINRGYFTKLLKEDADMGMKIYHNLLQTLVSRLRENNQYLSKSRQEAKKSRAESAKQIAASTV